MQAEILRKVNQYIKKTRPYLNPSHPCQVFKENELLEIGFLSKRCEHDAKGTCIMCDYGCAKGTYSDEIYLKEMEQILTKYSEDVVILLLCSNGSILNPNQISDGLFEKILLRAAQTDIPQIEIECHYKDVTIEKLDMIKKSLPNKKITIEMGLETVNPIYQKFFFGKGIDLDKYEDTILRIQSYGFKIDLNIILGLPFLSSKEQLKDACQTLDWVFNHQCSPVIFPVNIKPFTLLMHMYEYGYYKPISHWLMLSLLDTIKEENLNQVVVAWYGNREEFYEDSQIRAIFPTTCPDCKEAIKEFYNKFIICSNSHMRKKLIQSMMNTYKCSCKENLFSVEQTDYYFKKQFENYTAQLLNEFSFLF